jgi:hypothetical protein
VVAPSPSVGLPSPALQRLVVTRGLFRKFQGLPSGRYTVNEVVE